ncbi:G-type lectin S-receptor-like serine/threonine-protein kinase [Tanacetum coccineum]|uniref:G-type lectin S-receptor-like serine/threonine-protein kinase n=1 Tax=Tanacetum coccineum TaxID=301880 RepID=A0ABQ5HIB0_9ASTR
MAKIDEFMLCACILISFLTLSTAIDTIVANQTIKDGDTIVSAGDNFELGFFSPINSSNRYPGIRYKRISTGTVVWVSNKDTPLNDTSGVFKLSGDGSLLVFSGDNTLIWSSNLTGFYLNPVAQLLDTGNLVVRGTKGIGQEFIIWQSNPSYDACVRNGICGPYGTCNSNNSPVCGCLAGWLSKNFKGGISRQTTFMEYEHDTWRMFNGLQKELLLYGIWKCGYCDWMLAMVDDLQDMRVTSGARDLYVRATPYDLTGNASQTLDQDYTNESQKEPAELLSFSLSKVANSTDNFSINNKLGHGGFGPVFKGVLEGREIAVKRLSKTSSQGFDEFKNEVRCIAKLQHRNLVKLLGYYEVKSMMLDWPSRFHIIHGIARGLLYLHQDSRLRIIHRDRKAGNILLDLDMNPKISDFGLARRFRGHESEANTNKVVGTLGYISPEYAANGLFSVKSDVFSFGVLLLEIVSGKKNRGFSHLEHNDNLLGHAWRLYRAGKSLELVSAPLYDSCVDFEVIRAIHVGLLCVQDLAQDRPTMSLVVSMLDNDGVLPPPNQPAFFSEKSPVVMSSIPSTVAPVSVNVTITVLDAR